MKKMICLNPSVSTMNLGDCIIAESAKEQLAGILNGNFVVDISTHLPISHFYADFLADADLRFVLGTNLLRNEMKRKFRQWDIDFYSAKKLFPSVLMGVGWQNDGCSLTYTARRLYQRVLQNAPYMHSVRDAYTKEQLLKIGITNALNTGCPSMWKFTRDYCRTIPTEKAENVVFTVTDYSPQPDLDGGIVQLLKKHYKTVYVWLQGYHDYDYIEECGFANDVTIIPPELSAYDALLLRPDVEYIGTRLHGGIRALQHGRRTMILAVDERAIEKQRDFALPVIRRTEYEQLEQLIDRSRPTDIHIPEHAITQWKAQFDLQAEEKGE